MQLSSDNFALVIDSTPLVSVDLIIRNTSDEVLLGYRRNRPAQNFWFVPGGRIRKNEPLRAALARVAKVELGVELSAWELVGAYDHLYEDNALERPGVSTHYVALACLCTLASGSLIAADAQHAELRWWPMSELMTSPLVHLNTKRYFDAQADNRL